MNREHRRKNGAKATVKLGVEARLLLHERKLSALEAVFDKNTEAFTDSLCLADAMIWVLREAFTDMLNGHLTTLDRGVEKQIDLPFYLARYKAHIEEEAKREVSPLRDPTEPIIFGGT